MPIDAIAVTIRVTKALEALSVPYFIGGSIASTLYGMVRTTQDSDIIAELRAEHIPLFMAELKNEFYMDEKNDYADRRLEGWKDGRLEDCKIEG